MRASSVRATADAIVKSGDEPDQDLETSLDQWVREPSIVRDAGSVPNERVERPAHPSNRLVAQLNATWRVVDDPLQWRLQRKKGNPRKRNSGWRDRSFCTTRDGTAPLRARVLRRRRASCTRKAHRPPRALRDAELGRSRNRPSSRQRSIKAAGISGFGGL